jgi:hypothetical protein
MQSQTDSCRRRFYSQPGTAEGVGVGLQRLEVWPSLLSVAYLLLGRDIEGHFWPQECKNERCGRLFTPSVPAARYCSDSCQNAQMQREWRRRKKPASAAADTTRRETQ